MAKDANKNLILSDPFCGANYVADNIRRDNSWENSVVTLNALHSAAYGSSGSDSTRWSDSKIKAFSQGVISGYWHTIEDLSDDIKTYLKENFTIHTIDRPAEHSFVSGILQMASPTSLITSPTEISTDLVKKWCAMTKVSKTNKSKWTADKDHSFNTESVSYANRNGLNPDDLESSVVWATNKALISNWDSVYSTYQSNL